MNTVRRIAHLDMDAFYASVELLRYPDLLGQSVVIGGRSVHQPVMLNDGRREYARLRDYTGRGVITTSTYAARALGVFSGMGLMKAAKLAPDAILLPVDFEAYRHYSRLFKSAVAEIAPQIEDRGIDEIYIDLSDSTESSLSLAQRIKAAVRSATGLTCSIGISPNKLLSKICSDLEKPDGITILENDDLARRIWPLSVRKINGIGPKAGEKLASLKIETIAELASVELPFLSQHFGIRYAEWLYRAARGLDDSPVVTYSAPKSISRETTFERDLHPRHDRADLSKHFTALCEQVARDLVRKGYLGKTIGIKLRYEDFSTVTRDLTLSQATAQAAEIRRTAGQCLRRVSLDKRLRLMGVRVGSLVPANAGDINVTGVQGELPLG